MFSKTFLWKYSLVIRFILIAFTTYIENLTLSSYPQIRRWFKKSCWIREKYITKNESDKGIITNEINITTYEKDTNFFNNDYTCVNVFLIDIVKITVKGKLFYNIQLYLAWWRKSTMKLSDILYCIKLW